MQRVLITFFMAVVSALISQSETNVKELFSFENDTFAGVNLKYRKAEAGDSAKVAKFDVENSWGHRQTCEWSFTQERLSWLFE